MIEKNENILYREYDVVPVTGKYRCIICGNIEIFYKGESFSICNNCIHGKDDDIWVLMEELQIIEYGSI